MTEADEIALNAAYVLIPRLFTATSGKFFGLHNEHRVRFDTSTVLACEFYRSLPDCHTENAGEFCYISRAALTLWESLTNNKERNNHEYQVVDRRHQTNPPLPVG